MPLKNILVHLDSSHHAPARLDLAIELARKHQARLTALSVVTHQHYESLHADAEQKMEQISALFDKKISGSGIQGELLGVDWQVTGIAVTEIVNMHAHYADLVIVGQVDHASRDKDAPSDLPERVVLGAGRPVLIVPYAGTFTQCGTRALISWKPGREATRAVNDAIPLLTAADVVTVLEVNQTEADRDGGERLCGQLACHGITARVERATAVDISIGDVLLNRASIEGSDLLVMGAFAQTRLGTPALGDVARHILKYMTLPVLMSH